MLYKMSFVTFLCLLPANGLYSSASLCNASEKGDVACIQELIKRGEKVDSIDVAGVTPLMYAAEGGYAKAMRVLIDAGANINARDQDGCTALMFASWGGAIDAIRLLIEHGADINATSGYGNTPLAIAAGAGNCDAMHILIECGAEVHTDNTVGNTPLMQAISKGHTEAIRFLIAQGANVETRNRWGNTPLMLAVSGGHAEVVVILIQSGADIHAVDAAGQTALMRAACAGRAEVIHILIGYGVGLDRVDRNGKTALMHAARWNHSEVIDILVGYGAQLEIVDMEGKTAFIHAAHTDACAAVIALVKHSANMHMIDPHGDTAYMIACKRNRLNVLRALHILHTLQSQEEAIQSAFYLTPPLFDIKIRFPRIAGRVKARMHCNTMSRKQRKMAKKLVDKRWEDWMEEVTFNSMSQKESKRLEKRLQKMEETLTVLCKEEHLQDPFYRILRLGLVRSELEMLYQKTREIKKLLPLKAGALLQQENCYSEALEKNQRRVKTLKSRLRADFAQGGCEKLPEHNELECMSLLFPRQIAWLKEVAVAKRVVAHCNQKKNRFGVIRRLAKNFVYNDKNQRLFKVFEIIEHQLNQDSTLASHLLAFVLAPLEQFNVGVHIEARRAIASLANTVTIG